MIMGRSFRFTIVFRFLGWLMLVEAALMLIPLVMALFISDSDWLGFTLGAASAAVVGALLAFLFRRSPTRLNRRDAFLLTTVTWILFSLVGMIPFMTGTPALGVTDAFFETMSGFTTTGATVIADVEACHRPLLLWRSMIQWVGGLGIVLFFLALLPSLSQQGSLSMFNAEITGITHDKLHPRIRRTAMSLWKVYAALTLLEMLLLWAGPMDFFDAICHSLTTMSTGGFSTRNGSIASFDSPYAGWVVTVFMFAGGINFALLYGLMRGQLRALVGNDVMRAYSMIVGAAYVATAAYMVFSGQELSVDSILLNPLFMLTSAVTTTGFSYHGFDAWGAPGLLIVMLLMTSGACAGSTTGAVKIDRLLAMRRNLARQIGRTLYPNRLRYVNVNGKMIDDAGMGRVAAFLFLYLATTAAMTFVGCCYGISPGDSFFAALSCIGNNGLGHGLTSVSFAPLPDMVKWVFSVGMLIGRLELFTVFAIFTATFWRK